MDERAAEIGTDWGKIEELMEKNARIIKVSDTLEVRRRSQVYSAFLQRAFLLFPLPAIKQVHRKMALS